MNLAEKLLKGTEGRLTPEAAITSFTLFNLAHSHPFIQGTVSIFLNEQLKGTPPEMVAPYVIGLLGLSTLVNMFVEAKTLKKKGYSANAISTGLYFKNGDIPKSVLLGNIMGSINWADAGAVIVTLASVLSGNGVDNYVSSSLIAKSIISTGYWSGLNTLLMYDRLGFLTDKVNPVWNKFERKVGNIFRRDR